MTQWIQVSRVDRPADHPGDGGSPDHIVNLANNAFVPADPITDYPDGFSVFLSDLDQDPQFWPEAIVAVVLVHTHHALEVAEDLHWGYQIALRPGTQEMMRRFYSGAASAWTGWEVMGSADWDDLTGKPATFTPTTYIHTQNSASATWTMDHGLGRKPSCSFTDSAGNEVEGDVAHTSVNQTIGSFSSPFSGEAYLI